MADALQIAIAHQQAGRLSEAEALCREILRQSPRHGEAIHLLGVVFFQLGKHAESAHAIGQAIRLRGDRAAYHADLGQVYRILEKPVEAERCYRRAVQLEPTTGHFHTQLGMQLEFLQDDSGALRRVSRGWLRPAPHVEALFHWGNLLIRRGRMAEALELYDDVLKQNPGFAFVLVKRANLLRLLKQNERAVADYQRAIAVEPTNVEAYNNLAVFYNAQSCSDLAEAVCRQALTVHSQAAPLHANLAIALQQQGRMSEAIEHSRKAVELQPTDVAAHSNLLYALHAIPDLAPELLFAEHLEWARRHAEPLTRDATVPATVRDAHRRLRVGYISPYFREHGFKFYLEPILRCHDRQQFEIVCYADIVGGDAVTDRYRQLSDGWRETRTLTDQRLASLVGEDQVDILVDLTGHLAGNRLLMFARRAAPVQVTYLGYQNTTGMTAMHYRLTDAWCDPAGDSDSEVDRDSEGDTERLHTETLIRLPRAFFCFQPPQEAPEISPLPAQATGQVTFGSFNNFFKVTPRAIEAWMRILHRVPRSRLLVLAEREGFVAGQFARAAKRAGVDPRRIELINKCPREEYFRWLEQADVALDPFPFNGHTTTCDAIWMGVPVVMQAGRGYVTRYGGSVLRQVGLEHLICDSTDAYVERAVELAGNLDALADLRHALRPRMASSPLLDHAGFTQHLEAAYRGMWRAWCVWSPLLDIEPK